MDNNYLLLLIIKKHIDLLHFIIMVKNGYIVDYKSYRFHFGKLKNESLLMNEFEYNYLLSYLRMTGEL